MISCVWNYMSLLTVERPMVRSPTVAISVPILLLRLVLVLLFLCFKKSSSSLSWSSIILSRIFLFITPNIHSRGGTNNLQFSSPNINLNIQEKSDILSNYHIYFWQMCHFLKLKHDKLILSNNNWILFNIPGVLRRKESLTRLEACRGLLALQYFSR